MKRTTSVEPPKPPPPEPPPEPQFELPKLMGVSVQELDRGIWKMMAMLIFPTDGCELRLHNKQLDHDLASVLASPFARSVRNERAKRIINERGQKVREAQIEARKRAGIDKWPFPLTAFERTAQKQQYNELVKSGAFPVEKRELQWLLLDPIDIVLLPEDDPRQQWYDRALAIWNRHTHLLPPVAQRDLLLNRVRQLDQQLMKYFQLAQYTEGWALIEQFDAGLFAHIATLRERERTAAAPANQIRGCLGALQRCAWSAFEIDLLASLMRNGQTIREVNFYSVELSDGSTISRDDIKQRCRPSAARDNSKWEQNFTPARVIEQARELEAAQHRGE